MNKRNLIQRLIREELLSRRTFAQINRSSVEEEKETARNLIPLIKKELVGKGYPLGHFTRITVSETGETLHIEFSGSVSTYNKSCRVLLFGDESFKKNGGKIVLWFYAGPGGHGEIGEYPLPDALLNALKSAYKIFTNSDYTRPVNINNDKQFFERDGSLSNYLKHSGNHM